MYSALDVVPEWKRFIIVARYKDAVHRASGLPFTKLIVHLAMLRFYGRAFLLSRSYNGEEVEGHSQRLVAGGANLPRGFFSGWKCSYSCNQRIASAFKWKWVFMVAILVCRFEWSAFLEIVAELFFSPDTKVER
jgi:hypothetical protein